MFWSGNYMVVRELNYLLKEENVTLTQVLEADDILHECQADNKALMQFLTKPKILAELITLITEEPPKNVELASQYRHASIACEVLTSHLSTLSDHLSMDVVQMNRLCDFINRDPPLNPLLASYFSKTVEMLLERSPKQDWYLYHIVCLRVLDFFKSRRDFLPNLLRHISTSAIADTFKYFIRLDDLFNKIIMEWFEEHQFLECLIQIICGTYAPPPPTKAAADQPEKGQLEPSEKAPEHAANHADAEGVQNNVEAANESQEVEVKAEAGSGAGAEAEAEAEKRAARIAAVASANAAALLCDLILSGCAGDGYNTRARTSWALVGRLSGGGAARLLAGMFTAPPAARSAALVHGARVLLALLDRDPPPGAECDSERSSVEMAVAPHLPLLHQALLEEPADAPGRVGLARVQVAALLAHLCTSTVQEVCATMVTLGTPGVVLDMMFKYEHNNFLHAQAEAMVKHALQNHAFRSQYATHLLAECDLLTRLMDAFEDNENKMAGSPRSGYMGHVILMLRTVGAALAADSALERLLAPATLQRYHALLARRLHATLQQHDTPLGGYYPSENAYEFNEPGGAGAELGPAGLDGLAADDALEMVGGTSDPTDFLADELDMDDGDKMESKSNFLELASQRFDDDMWEDSPAADAEAEEEAEAEGDDCAIHKVREVLAQPSPWDSNPPGESGETGEGGGSGGGGEGWAQFDAPAAETCFWPYTENATQEDIEQNMRNLQLENEFEKLEGSSVELANKLLTAMSSMPPHLVAHLVQPLPPHGDGPDLDRTNPSDSSDTQHDLFEDNFNIEPTETQKVEKSPSDDIKTEAKVTLEQDKTSDNLAETETKSEDKVVSDSQKESEPSIETTQSSEEPPPRDNQDDTTSESTVTHPDSDPSDAQR